MSKHYENQFLPPLEYLRVLEGLLLILRPLESAEPSQQPPQPEAAKRYPQQPEPQPWQSPIQEVPMSRHPQQSQPQKLVPQPQSQPLRYPSGFSPYYCPPAFSAQTHPQQSPSQIGPISRHSPQHERQSQHYSPGFSIHPQFTPKHRSQSQQWPPQSLLKPFEFLEPDESNKSELKQWPLQPGEEVFEVVKPQESNSSDSSGSTVSSVSSDESNKAEELNESESTDKVNHSTKVRDKLQQELNKICKISSTFISDSFSRKESPRTLYQLIKDSTPDIYCTPWAEKSTIPYCPPKTVLKKTAKILMDSKKHRSRQWKSPIIFHWEDQFHCDAIVCENIHIPYSYEKGYGSSFVYLRLPRALQQCLREASHEYPFLSMMDKDLQCSRGRHWWKVAINVSDNVFGIVDELNEFEPKSLKRIFELTEKGVTASLVLRFHSEATTKGRRPLHRRDVRKIGVEIVRGNIEAIKKDIELPYGPGRYRQDAGWHVYDNINDRLRWMTI